MMLYHILSCHAMQLLRVIAVYHRPADRLALMAAMFPTTSEDWVNATVVGRRSVKLKVDSVAWCVLQVWRTRERDREADAGTIHGEVGGWSEEGKKEVRQTPEVWPARRHPRSRSIHDAIARELTMDKLVGIQDWDACQGTNIDSEKACWRCPCT